MNGLKPFFNTAEPRPINFTITTVKNIHLEGKVRSTEQFNYDADCAFTALRIWLQTNFSSFCSPKDGVLFIAIHPTADKSESAKVANHVLKLSQP